jgi:hypothetical protein
MRVHFQTMRTMAGVMDAYKKIIREPLVADNQMLRYDAAYMLAMVWQQDCPDEAIDRLGEFLHDEKYKIFRKTTSGVGGTSSETVGGTATVKEVLDGDGRMMALDALERLGPRRYAQRPEIMAQLRVLAGNKSLYEPLRKKSADLVRAAQ